MSSIWTHISSGIWTCRQRLTSFVQYLAVLLSEKCEKKYFISVNIYRMVTIFIRKTASSFNFTLVLLTNEKFHFGNFLLFLQNFLLTLMLRVSLGWTHSWCTESFQPGLWKEQFLLLYPAFISNINQVADITDWYL